MDSLLELLKENTISIDTEKENKNLYGEIVFRNLNFDFVQYIFEKFKLEYDKKEIFETYIKADDVSLNRYNECYCVGEGGSLLPFGYYIINKLVNSNPKRVSKALWEYLFKDENEKEVLSKLKDSFTESEDIEDDSERADNVLYYASLLSYFFKNTDVWCENLSRDLYECAIKDENKAKRNKFGVNLAIDDLWKNLPYSKEEFLNTFYYNNEIKRIDAILAETLPEIHKEVLYKKIDNIIYDCVKKFQDWKYIKPAKEKKKKAVEIGRLSREDAYLIIGFIQSRIVQMIDSYSIIKVQLSDKCLQLSSNEEGVTVIDNTEELQALQDENNLLSINNKKLQAEKDNLQTQLNVFLKDEKREENEEIRELKKQIALLENQIFDKDAKLKELENYTKIIEGNSEAFLDIIEDYDLDFLKSKRFLFIGGREETNRELEKIFPNAKFVNNENMDIFINDKLNDCSFLPDSMKMLNSRTQFDYIVFFPKFMNHALFYKYKKEGINRNIPYMLINFNNIDLILKNMYLEIITGADAEIA